VLVVSPLRNRQTPIRLHPDIHDIGRVTTEATNTAREHAHADLAEEREGS